MLYHYYMMIDMIDRLYLILFPCHNTLPPPPLLSPLTTIHQTQLKSAA